MPLLRTARLLSHSGILDRSGDRRLGVSLLGGHGAAGGRPARTLAPAGTATDHPEIASSRAQCARSSDRRGSRSRGRRRWPQIGRSAHPAPPARRSARPRQPEPSWRSSVGHLAEALPPSAAAAVTSRFGIARRLSAAGIGIERSGAASRCSPRSSRNPGPMANARPTRQAVAEIQLGAQPSQSRGCCPQAGSLIPRNGDGLGQ
jgi:hypothetical protein